MVTKNKTFNIGNALSGTYLLPTDWRQGNMKFGIGTYSLTYKHIEKYTKGFEWLFRLTDIPGYYLIINKKNGRALLPKHDNQDGQKLGQSEPGYMATGHVATGHVVTDPINLLDGCSNKAFYWKVQTVAIATSGTPLTITRLNKNDIKNGLQDDQPKNGGEHLYTIVNYLTKNELLASKRDSGWLSGEPTVYQYPIKNYKNAPIESRFLWLIHATI